MLAFSATHFYLLEQISHLAVPAVDFDFLAAQLPPAPFAVTALDAVAGRFGALTAKVLVTG